MEPDEVRVTVTVDGEGVVRVAQSNCESVNLTMRELGQLLTAIVKSIVSVSDDDETFDVRLN